MSIRHLGVFLIALVLAGCDGNVNENTDLAVVTIRVSLDANRNELDAFSAQPSITPDGRYVAFCSACTSLVPNDNNGVPDIFRRDTITGEVIRVSIGDGAGGAEANAPCFRPVISADGNRIAWESNASTLGADADGASDIFMRDIANNQTLWISQRDIGGKAATPGDSFKPSISADGTKVTFESGAFPLETLSGVADDQATDIYLRDLSGPTTILISRMTGAGGAHPLNASSFGAMISHDGMHVVFTSDSNLDPADADFRTFDIYVRDLPSTTILITPVDDDDSTQGSISADGRFVTFVSRSTLLVPSDANGSIEDVFLWERGAAVPISKVSISNKGTQGQASCSTSSVSADGRYVAYASLASNLVQNDNNNTIDIFLRDRVDHRTERISVRTFGTEGNNSSTNPQITPDGKYVVFESFAGNLVDDDGNGVSDIFIRGPLH